MPTFLKTEPISREQSSILAWMRRSSRWCSAGSEGVRVSSILVSRLERVCDGHGDLQAEDIFCLEDGVRILDCIEFSDQLRYGDVCADVAFLAMDLERLGRVRRSRAVSGPLSGLCGASDSLSRSCITTLPPRAYIRAKVACLRAEQGE